MAGTELSFYSHITDTGISIVDQYQRELEDKYREVKGLADHNKVPIYCLGRVAMELETRGISTEFTPNMTFPFSIAKQR